MSARKRLTRRRFLRTTAGLGASALAVTSESLAGTERPQQKSRSVAGQHSFFDLIRQPDFVWTYETTTPASASAQGSSWKTNGIAIETNVIPPAGDKPWRLGISLAAPQQLLSRIHLRWKAQAPRGLRFLGDAWERAYGDLEWRGLVGERIMPWYFLVHDGERTHGYGVATGPSAMAFWRVDNAGVSLWLDVRNGSSPVLLGERTLELCDVITREGREDETPWQAAHSFCGLLCRNPRLPKAPVYGGNNWYYAYGENCSAKAIERDGAVVADLSGGHSNRPFEVIDDGWQLAGANSGCCSGGPWRFGNSGFPDMPGLASLLKALGVRPGLWMRPLLTHERGLEPWALKRPHGTNGPELILDPSIPEACEHIRADIAGLVAWGYELIKHDFSTEDIFGRFGPRMGSTFTESGWSFHDRSRTTAEVILSLYHAIRQGAGEQTVVIGCNTVGHLGAGVFDLQRTGDDTSGQKWDTTRRMGVNALAFRGVQHGAFFAADADCVGVTSAIPWSLNKQWLDLVSRTGTPLFVSAAPEALLDEQRRAIREAFVRAASGHSAAEPLDWLDTTTPEKWRCDGETVTYDWYSATGDTGD